MNSIHFFMVLVSFALFWTSEALPRRLQEDDESTVLMTACLQERGSTVSAVFFTKSSSPETYDKLNYQWNTRFGNIQPMAILAANTPEDVSNGILCAKELGVHVVAKSGGHSYEKYSSGDNETVVIDLINMKTINVDQAAKIVEVGAGVLLSHLYSAIWNNGKLGLGAGSCVGVGAAHTLGAGYGFLSKRFGVTLDNVIEMELIDANGDIKIASLEKNPDLFWALRGAGAGSFGIVTKLKYQLFDAQDMIFTQISFSYDISRFSEVFESWNAWNTADQNGNAYGLFSARADNIHVTVLDAGLTEVDVQDIISKFPAGTPHVKYLNFIELVVDGSWPHVEAEDLANVKREDQPPQAFKAKSYFSSKSHSAEEIEQLKPVLTRVPWEAYVHFSSYGGAINRVPSDATAFVHRNSLYNIQIAMDDTNESEELAAWLQDFDDVAMAVLDNGESYQNYNDGTLGNYLERYYGSNLARLIEIKRNLDPTNFFRFAQSIPLIWNESK